MNENETKESLLDRIAGKVATQLSSLFEKKVELERAKLVNGVEVEIEQEEVYVFNEEGERIPAPVGEHELEDGRIVVVVEEGKLSEIKEAEALKEDDKDDKQEFASLEDFASLKKEVEELKAMLQPKEELKAEEAPEPEKEEPKEVELKAEEKVEKINHSPEKEVSKQKLTLHSQSRQKTIKDGVYQNLFN